MDDFFQKLNLFRVPHGFRGRSVFVVQIWWFIRTILFHPSPQFAYRFRCTLLRAFGANIGKNVLIRPSVTVTYPWNLTIDDYSWVGDDVILYSLGKISIGSNSVVSQRSYICAADHDYKRVNFPIRSRPVTIGAQVWIATDVFVAPGVSIGDGVVIGARSSVLHDMPEGMVCYGYPCKVVRKRAMESM